jgi:hypothetical protein
MYKIKDKHIHKTNMIIDFEIKNERQDCKIGTVWRVLVGGGG